MVVCMYIAILDSRCIEERLSSGLGIRMGFLSVGLGRRGERGKKGEGIMFPFISFAHSQSFVRLFPSSLWVPLGGSSFGRGGEGGKRILPSLPSLSPPILHPILIPKKPHLNLRISDSKHALFFFFSSHSRKISSRKKNLEKPLNQETWLKPISKARERANIVCERERERD